MRSFERATLIVIFHVIALVLRSCSGEQPVVRDIVDPIANIDVQANIEVAGLPPRHHHNATADGVGEAVDDILDSLDDLDHFVEEGSDVASKVIALQKSLLSNAILDDILKLLQGSVQTGKPLTKIQIAVFREKIRKEKERQNIEVAHLEAVLGELTNVLKGMNGTRIELEGARQSLEQKEAGIDTALKEAMYLKRVEEIVNGEIDYDAGVVHVHGVTDYDVSIDEANELLLEAGVHDKMGMMPAGDTGLISDPAVFNKDIRMLESIVVLLSAAAIGGFLAALCQAPATLGYIVAGVVVGQFGLGLITHVLQVQTLGHIGVLFIMFQHGIEYPVDYRTFSASHAIGGLVVMYLQWVFCCSFGLMMKYIPNVPEGIMFGAAMCVSSSVTVVEFLRKTKQSESTPAQHLAGMLAVQDLTMALLLSLPEVIAQITDGRLGGAGRVLLQLFVAVCVVLALCVLLAKYLVPTLLNYLSRSTRSREIAMLGVVSICLALGLITDICGLSLEMGAFLAGLTLTDIKHRERALRTVEPLTGVFGGMFYAALGLTLNPNFLWKELSTMVVMSIQIFFIKVVTVTLFLMFFMLSPRDSLLLSIPMANVSEFSMVFMSKVQDHKFFSRKLYLNMLGSVVLMTVLTPFLTRSLPAPSFHGVTMTSMQMTNTRGALRHKDEDSDGDSERGRLPRKNHKRKQSSRGSLSGPGIKWGYDQGSII